MKGLAETQPAEEKAGKKKIKRIAVIAAAVLLGAVAVLTALFISSCSDRRALEEALTETEKKLELREKTAAAMEEQQKEQKAEIEKLQEKIDDLLNIEEPAPVITSDQLEDQLSSIRELVTKKYTYTNAAIREANKTWLWGWTMPFSETSLLVTYDGIIKAGIDLSEVKIDVDEDSRTITVTLPASEITDNSIPQETINVLEAKDSLFNKITFDDYNKFISDEKPIMEEKAVSMGLLADADQEAKAVVQAFLSLVPGIDSYQLIIE